MDGIQNNLYTTELFGRDTSNWKWERIDYETRLHRSIVLYGRRVEIDFKEQRRNVVPSYGVIVPRGGCVKKKSTGAGAFPKIIRVRNRWDIPP